MRLLATVISLLLLVPAATAQIIFQGGAFQTNVSANTPGCSDFGGDVGLSPASATCTTGGYSAVSSATAGFSTHPKGGATTASAEAAATSIGPPAQDQSSATSTNNASAGWKISVTTHYSLVTETSGGAFVNFSGPGISFPAPASGILTGTGIGDGYSLNVSVTASAFALDSGGAQTVTGVPQHVIASVTFAEVGSSTLIMGTVLAGGVAMPNLFVEALDGLVVVATTQTANDGSYLLDGLPTSVTLRISDPNSLFVTETSPLLFPPTTYNADLAPISAVPALGASMLLLLTLLLTLIATRNRSHRT